MERWLNTVLLILLAALVGSTWLMRRDYAQRNAEFLPGMVSTPRYNDQSANPAFPDGKTLQRPAAGTISMGHVPVHYGITPEEAARAGEELKNPIPDSVEAELDRGGLVFSTFCQPCHGTGGLGDGTVTKRGFPPPPSLLAEKALKLKDGQMFHILTYGQGNMPSLASQIARQDRWRVIKKVRSLQKQAGVVRR